MKAIALDNLNIRQSADINSKRLGGILKGSVIDIGAQSNNYWSLVNAPGYVSATWVTTSFNSSTTFYTTDGLNVRNQPSILGTKTGSVSTGTKVTANTSFFGNGYVLITMPQIGYVLRSNLSISASSGIPTPIPPINPPKTRNLVGLHIETPTSNQILLTAQRLKQAGKSFAAITILDDVGLANALAPNVEHLNFRSYPHGQQFNPGALTSIQAAIDHANFIYEQHWPIVSQLSGKNITVQFRNESSEFPFDSYFELQLMKRADHDGKFKVGMFGDSLGSPTIEQWETRENALSYAMQYGHIAILHEYGAEINDHPANVPMSDPATRQWYGLRHEMLYNGVPANCRPFCIIGECGLSSAVPDTIEDFRAYNQLLLNDPYILGFCIWGFGATAPAYNANPELPAIEQLIMSL